jgi:Xaa-Pro dipeptidase
VEGVRGADRIASLHEATRPAVIIVAGHAEVAFSIHQYQVKQGMQKYIYNRPAHGQGMEGHQPPYIALGDHTVLDTGMCFSVEPGLYDLEAQIGSNFSDLLAIQPEGPALQMSRLPWSEEWAWVTI